MLKKLLIYIICIVFIVPNYLFGMYKTPIFREPFKQTGNKLFRSMAKLLMTRKEALDFFGLDYDASLDQIKKAYRKAVLLNHPDSSGGSDAKMKKVNEAMDVLRKKEDIKEYITEPKNNCDHDNYNRNHDNKNNHNNYNCNHDNYSSNNCNPNNDSWDQKDYHKERADNKERRDNNYYKSSYYDRYTYCNFYKYENYFYEYSTCYERDIITGIMRKRFHINFKFPCYLGVSMIYSLYSREKN